MLKPRLTVQYRFVALLQPHLAGVERTPIALLVQFAEVVSADSTHVAQYVTEVSTVGVIAGQRGVNYNPRQLVQVDCHRRQRSVIQAQLQRDRLKGPTSRRALPERLQLRFCQRQTFDQNLEQRFRIRASLAHKTQKKRWLIGGENPSFTI